MDIVEVALGEVSTETGGLKYIRWYGGFGAGTAWCSIFVSWCAAQAGIGQSIIPKTASTTEGMNWFRQKGLFSAKGTYQPKRGDLVFFKTGMSHVGIVIDCDGSKVNTVEGNTSNRVAKRSYSINDGHITGYGTPKYPGSVGTGGSLGGGKAESKKEITSVKLVYSTEGKPEPRRDDTVEATPLSDLPYELLIQHEGELQMPVVCDGVKLKRQRRGSPAQLEFSVLKDDKLNFQEGDPVTFRVREVQAFHGYVFKKSRNSDGQIKVTAYDQIRYLKNHDTYLYEGITVGELLQRMAADFQLTVGAIDDTGYKLPHTLSDDKALLDMLEDALDLTLIMTGEMYVLYDDFGKLTLKNADTMALDLLVNEAVAGDFDYTSSIDSDVYNQIKLGFDNEETGTREHYVEWDNERIGQWGVLQKYIKVNSTDNILEKGKAYLKLYNRKSRSLSIKNVMGDIRVRGGSKIYINLNLGDIIANHQMMVESVQHTFKENEHLMDVTMRGWDFV